MTINYDKVADAIYFLMKKGRVAKTISVNENLNIDVDSNGATLGIEILEASSEQGEQLKKTVKTGFPVNITENTPVTI